MSITLRLSSPYTAQDLLVLNGDDNEQDHLSLYLNPAALVWLDVDRSGYGSAVPSSGGRWTAPGT